MIIPDQICDELSCGEAEFHRILGQKGQNYFEGQVNDPLFNTGWGYPAVHVWCKFGDSSLNMWRVMREGKVYERTLDIRSQREYHFDLKSQGVQMK